MKNNDLIALQNKLFEAMEYLQDRDVEGEELVAEINRSMALNEIAKTAIANGALMLKCSNDLYGIPVDESLPLIPASPDDNPKIINRKRDGLIDIPKGKAKKNV
jgi:hypothetical protein